MGDSDNRYQHDVSNDNPSHQRLQCFSIKWYLVPIYWNYSA